MYSNRTARELHVRLLIAMSLEEAKGVLGFPPGYHPTKAEINKAYKLRALESHPDRGGTTEKMVEVNVAKEVLDGKTRSDFKFQEDDSKKRAKRIQADIKTIRSAQSFLQHVLSTNATSSIAFPNQNDFGEFLVGPFASHVDRVEDAAEKSLRTPESKEDAKALKKVIALTDKIQALTMKLSVRYRELRRSPPESYSTLLYHATKCNEVADRIRNLNKLAGELSALLTMGLPPDGDAGVSIPEIVIDGYWDHARSHIDSYAGYLRSFNADEVKNLKSRLEGIITNVIGIVSAHGIDLEGNMLSGDWTEWYSGSFDIAVSLLEALINSKTASIESRVASRYQAKHGLV